MNWVCATVRLRPLRGGRQPAVRQMEAPRGLTGRRVQPGRWRPGRCAIAAPPEALTEGWRPPRLSGRAVLPVTPGATSVRSHSTETLTCASSDSTFDHALAPSARLTLTPLDRNERRLGCNVTPEEAIPRDCGICPTDPTLRDCDSDAPRTVSLQRIKPRNERGDLRTGTQHRSTDQLQAPRSRSAAPTDEGPELCKRASNRRFSSTMRVWLAGPCHNQLSLWLPRFRDQSVY
jgi:hypothetical protein